MTSITCRKILSYLASIASIIMAPKKNSTPKKNRTKNRRKRYATQDSTHSPKATKVDGSYHMKFTNFKESYPSIEVMITKLPRKPVSSGKDLQVPIKSPSSEALRKKGNEIYSQVSNGFYGPCLLRHKLGKAHELYEAALDAASLNDESEKASCYKNLGAVNLIWGKVEWKIYIEEQEGTEALKAIWTAKRHISTSLEFYLLAIEFGELHDTKPDTWLKQAEDSVTQILEWVRAHTG
ncbi:uncharacterized protein LOC131070682 [Cryptomeria japonica]|uniref:uncharacterized protein LOC131070682 n=1 Tax=Cryptomeria japonica TaxID=3369 RepID=UPI0027D9EDFF|nr:uncharacterized protein LOC131070682 [Cryptomeria japonica]